MKTRQTCMCLCANHVQTANLQLGTLECSAPEVLECPLANEDYAAGHPHDPAVG